ncbi:protein of unknown function [Kyrpidia spormannii]|uniref:Uncharacterized protein n=1 Tax=Kyrpidia spormannii TaxID=2055160 RepID=A0A6F9EGI0_9BACL|nr:protein of unknown function [Kyrpidia spormannii]
MLRSQRDPGQARGASDLCEFSLFPWRDLRYTGSGTVKFSFGRDEGCQDPGPAAPAATPTKITKRGMAGNGGS